MSGTVRTTFDIKIAHCCHVESKVTHGDNIFETFDESPERISSCYSLNFVGCHVVVSFTRIDKMKKTLGSFVVSRSEHEGTCQTACHALHPT